VGRVWGEGFGGAAGAKEGSLEGRGWNMDLIMGQAEGTSIAPKLGALKRPCLLDGNVPLNPKP